MNEEELKTLINKLRSHLRYYKVANREYKRLNIILRRKARQFYVRVKELKKEHMEKDYLIVELLKKVSELNERKY